MVITILVRPECWLGSVIKAQSRCDPFLGHRSQLHTELAANVFVVSKLTPAKVIAMMECLSVKCKD